MRIASLIIIALLAIISHAVAGEIQVGSVSELKGAIADANMYSNHDLIKLAFPAGNGVHTIVDQLVVTSDVTIDLIGTDGKPLKLRTTHASGILFQFSNACSFIIRNAELDANAIGAGYAIQTDNGCHDYQIENISFTGLNGIRITGSDLTVLRGKINNCVFLSDSTAINADNFDSLTIDNCRFNLESNNAIATARCRQYFANGYRLTFGSSYGNICVYNDNREPINIVDCQFVFIYNNKFNSLNGDASFPNYNNFSALAALRLEWVSHFQIGSLSQKANVWGTHDNGDASYNLWLKECANGKIENNVFGAVNSSMLYDKKSRILIEGNSLVSDARIFFRNNTLSAHAQLYVYQINGVRVFNTFTSNTAAQKPHVLNAVTGSAYGNPDINGGAFKRPPPSIAWFRYYDRNKILVRVNAPYANDTIHVYRSTANPADRQVIGYLGQAVTTSAGWQNLVVPVNTTQAIAGIAATGTTAGRTSEFVFVQGPQKCLSVDTTVGDGPGTLEWAIGCANYFPGKARLDFSGLSANAIIELERSINVTDTLTMVGTLPGGSFVRIIPKAGGTGTFSISILAGAEGSDIQNTTFTGYSNIESGLGALVVACDNVRVNNCIFDACYNSLAVSGSQNRITSNRFLNYGGYGLQLTDDIGTLLEWNLFSNGATGLKLRGSKGVQVGTRWSHNDFLRLYTAIDARRTRNLAITRNFFGGPSLSDSINGFAIKLDSTIGTTIGNGIDSSINYFQNIRAVDAIVAQNSSNLTVQNNRFGFTRSLVVSSLENRVRSFMSLINSDTVVIGGNSFPNWIHNQVQYPAAGPFTPIDADVNSAFISFLFNRVTAAAPLAIKPFRSVFSTNSGLSPPELQIMDVGTSFRVRAVSAGGVNIFPIYRQLGWMAYGSNGSNHILLSLTGGLANNEWSPAYPKSSTSHVIGNIQYYNTGGSRNYLHSSEFTNPVPTNCGSIGSDSIGIVNGRNSQLLFPGDTLQFSAVGLEEEGVNECQWQLSGPKSAYGLNSPFAVTNCPEGQYTITLTYQNGSCYRQVRRVFYVTSTIKPVITKVIPSSCDTARKGYVEFFVAYDTLITGQSYLVCGADTVRRFTRLSVNSTGSRYRVSGLKPGSYALYLKPRFAQGMEVLLVDIGASQPQVSVLGTSYAPCDMNSSTVQGRVKFQFNYNSTLFDTSSYKFTVSLRTASGVTVTGARVIDGVANGIDSLSFSAGGSNRARLFGPLVLSLSVAVPGADGCACFTNICSSSVTFYLPQPRYRLESSNATPGSRPFTFVTCGGIKALPRFVLQEDEPVTPVLNRRLSTVSIAVTGSGGFAWDTTYVGMTKVLPLAIATRSLAIGRYKIKVTVDDLGGPWLLTGTIPHKNCVLEDSFYVQPPAELNPIVISTLPSRCTGTPGSATLDAIGYFNPQYYWLRKVGANYVVFDSTSGHTLSSIYSRSVNDSLIRYRYLVKDNFGCSSTGDFVIDTVPSPAVPDLTVNNGCNITANMPASNGQGTYVLYWYRNALSSDSVIFTSVLPADVPGVSLLPQRNLPDSALLIVRVRNSHYCWSKPDSVFYQKPEVKRRLPVCIRWGAPPAKPVPPVVITQLKTMDAGAASREINDQAAACNRVNMQVITGLIDNVCQNAEGYNDKLQIEYKQKAEHTTLYFHDRAGNLVATVPPQGVANLTSKPADRNTMPNYQLATYYRYNTLGQKILEISPDADTTWFVYDQAGRLRLQRTAAQRDSRQFTYFRYDALARLVESGVVKGLAFDFKRSEDLDYLNAAFKPAGHIDFNKYPEFHRDSLVEQTLTVYNTPDTTVVFNRHRQRNLNNKISYTRQLNNRAHGGPAAVGGDTVYTHYSYDPHGNVEWIQQTLPGFGVSHVAYDYDLVSGKVRCVRLNPGRADQFFTRYSYDQDNRIVQVETSRDSLLWERDAIYDYYLHGPLRRTVLGHDSVQGLDYTYTLNGWLKGINSPDGLGDLGQDGGAGRGTARDAFAMRINYFSGDYVAQNAMARNNGLLPGQKNLYNGNIGGIDELNREAYGFQSRPLRHVYGYDSLNRIRSSRTSGYANARALATSYTYDANGNIQQLVRRDEKGDRIDSLVYTYEVGKNQLKAVVDQVATPGRADDVEGTLQYEYDKSGRLVRDIAQNVYISWNAANKVRLVKHVNGSQVTYTEYLYDATGEKVGRRTYAGTQVYDYSATYYVRAADGNVLANYNKKVTQSGSDYVAEYKQTEVPVYGSDRIGQSRPGRTSSRDTNLVAAVKQLTHDFDSVYVEVAYRQLGQKDYELHDHLGNVRSVVSDQRIMDSLDQGGRFHADVKSRSDYYPFGMEVKAAEHLTLRKLPPPGLTWTAMDITANLSDYGFAWSLQPGQFTDHYPLPGCYELSFTDYEFFSNPDPNRHIYLQVLDGDFSTIIDKEIWPDADGKYKVDFCISQGQGVVNLWEVSGVEFYFADLLYRGTTDRVVYDTAMVSVTEMHHKWGYGNDPVLHYADNLCSSPEQSGVGVDLNNSPWGLQPGLNRVFQVPVDGLYKITAAVCTGDFWPSMSIDQGDDLDGPWIAGNGMPLSLAGNRQVTQLSGNEFLITAYLEAYAGQNYAAYLFDSTFTGNGDLRLSLFKVERVKDSLPDPSQAPYSAYRYRYNGKEWVNDFRFLDYGERNFDPRLGRWFVVDKLASVAPGWSPYRAFFDNPINFLDSRGDFESPDDYIVDQKGILQKIVPTKSEHRLFVESPDKRLTELSFNDPANDRAQLARFTLGAHLLRTVTDENINYIMEKSGIKPIDGTLSRLYFAATQSQNRMDFSYQYLFPAVGITPGESPIEYEGRGGFYRFGSNNKAYNISDGGNFLWGHGMKRIGFGVDMSTFGAQLNEGFDDTEADQNAIREGHSYSVGTNQAEAGEFDLMPAEPFEDVNSR